MNTAKIAEIPNAKFYLYFFLKTFRAQWAALERSKSLQFRYC